MSVLKDLARGLDPDVALNRELLEYHVGRQQFCPKSSKALDRTTAVLVTIKLPDGSPHTTVAMAADEWDKVASSVTEQCTRQQFPLEVLDGRQLFGSRS